MCSSVLCSFGTLHCTRVHPVLLSRPPSAMKMFMVFHTLPCFGLFLWATAYWMALINWVAPLAVFSSAHRGMSTQSQKGRFVWSILSVITYSLCGASLYIKLIHLQTPLILILIMCAGDSSGYSPFLNFYNFDSITTYDPGDTWST